MKSKFEILASVTKEAPHSKVGVTFGIEPDGEYPFVSKMKKSSPFSETDLSVGMRVLSINDIDLKGKFLKECTGIIKSAPSKVKILASVEDMEKEGLIIHDDFSSINLPRWYIPSYLVTAWVTEGEWSKIYDMIHDKLYPALRNTIGCDNILSQVFGGYVNSQMVGGVVVFGVEVRPILRKFEKFLFVRTHLPITCSQRCKKSWYSN